MRRAKKNVAVSDINVELVNPIEEEDIAVPQLEEIQLYELNRVVDRVFNPPPPTSTSPSSTPPLMALSPPPAAIRAQVPFHLVVDSSKSRPASPTSSPTKKKKNFDPAQQLAAAALIAPPLSAAATATPGTTPATTPATPAKKPAKSGGGGGGELDLPPKEDLMLKLMAYYKKVHGTGGLRVHEELSRNLGINIGPIAYVEQLLYKQMCQRYPEVKSLPPVAVLVLHLFTCEVKDIHSLFAFKQTDQSEAPAAGDANGRVRGAALKALLAHKLKAAAKKREMGGIEVDDTPQTLFHEVLRAVQQRELPVLNKWIGTVCLVLAALDVVATWPSAQVSMETHNDAFASSLGAIPGSTGQSPMSGVAGVEGAENQKKKSKKEKEKVDDLGVDLLTHVEMGFACTFLDMSQTMMAFERLASVPPTDPVEIPLLQPLGKPVEFSELPLPVLAREEEHVEPPLEKNEEGELRSHVDKAQLRCEGWTMADPGIPVVVIPITPPVPGAKVPKNAPVPQPPLGVPPTVSSPLISSIPMRLKIFVDTSTGPPPNLEGSPSAAIGAQKPPTPISGAGATSPVGQKPPAPLTGSMPDSAASSGLPLVAQGPAVVDLGMFTFTPKDPLTGATRNFVVPIPLRSHAIVTEFQPQFLLLTIRLMGTDRTSQTALGAQFKVFLEGVLSDAQKACSVAQSITRRLVSQFIKPHHCRQHPKQKYGYLCNDCQRLICVQCAKEVHVDHKMTLLAAMCIDDLANLERKKAVAKKRMNCLRGLLKGVPTQEAKMHDTINAGLDEVNIQIKARRQYLHTDAEKRSSLQETQLERELKHCDIDHSKVLDARNEVGNMATGGTMMAAAPSVKLHKRMQVKDNLHLRIATKEICKLIQLLTWSNPSKYLTRAVYPPADEVKTVVANDGKSSAGGPTAGTVATRLPYYKR